VCKIAVNATQLANCITVYGFQPRVHKQKLHRAYLASNHNSIFDYYLRTIEAENP